MWKRLILIGGILLFGCTTISALDIPDFFKGAWIDIQTLEQYAVTDLNFLIDDLLVDDSYIVSDNYTTDEIVDASGNVTMEETYIMACTTGSIFIFSTQGEDIHLTIMSPVMMGVFVPVHISLLMSPDRFYEELEKYRMQEPQIPIPEGKLL